MSPGRSTFSRKGLSLFEAVLTIFLVFMVFWVAADLLHNASRAVRFGDAKSRSAQAVQLALQRMTNEAREAYQLVTTGSDLTLLKVDPAPGRLPNPLPTPAGAPGSWDPAAGSLQVRYWVDGQKRLWRDVGPSSQLIAEGISGFSTQLLPNGNLEVSLALNEDTQVKTFTTQVLMMAVP